MITRNDVARRAGVSVAVVSYVLNNKSIVKEETRHRVLQAMEELGYEPHHGARSLKTRKSGQLAVLTTFIGNPFEAGILLHLEEAARNNGYIVTYHTYADTNEQELKTLLAGRADGIVLLGQSLSESTLAFFAKREVPVVSVMTPAQSDSGMGWVDVDWQETYAGVIQELRRLGHREVAYMGHGDPASPLAAREAAFLRALAFAEGIRLSPTGLLSGGGRYESALDAFASLPQRPAYTAVVCANDLMAIGVNAACRRKGWHVPNELSIVGSEDILMAAETHPPLAALQYPRREAALAAMERLLALLGSSESEVERQVMAAPLAVRASLGPARSEH